MVRAGLLALALCLLPGCGDQAAPAPERPAPIQLMSFNSGACDTLGEPYLDATLTVPEGTWGLTYHIEAGRFFLEGELIKDTLVELQYCDLEIDTLGAYIVVDKVAECRPSVFSPCKAGE
jgi:hypothetical protein